MIDGSAIRLPLLHAGSAERRVLDVELDLLRAEGIAALHHRRISRVTLDHIVVAPSGVFVVEAHDDEGVVECRNVGGLFSVDRRLYVDGRDRTKLVGGLERQIEAVQRALYPEFDQTPIFAVICFVNGACEEPFVLDDVHVVSPQALVELVRGEGRGEVAAVEARLAA
jgi:hypothetical protein